MINLLSSVAVASSGFYVDARTQGFLAWIFIGLLAMDRGARHPRPRLRLHRVDIILGLIGAGNRRMDFHEARYRGLGILGSLAAATVGAVVLVAIARLFAGSSD